MNINELEACISICKSLCHEELKTLDVDKVLSEMNDLEKKGGFFMSIIDDYKQVKKEEAMRKFTFRPDTIEDQNITKRKRNIYRFVVGNMLGIVLLLYFIINGIVIERNIGLSLLMAVVLLLVMVWTFRVE